MNILFLKMGGIGSRFNDGLGGLPKQFVEVDGTPLFCCILQKYVATGLFSRFVLATNKDYLSLTQDLVKKFFPSEHIDIILGGSTGAETIRNGVMFIKSFASDNDILFIHDATNPIILSKYFPEFIKECESNDAVTVVREMVHAVFNIDEEGYVFKNVDKKKIVSNYTPELYVFKKVYEIYSSVTEEELSTSVSSIDMAIRHNCKIKTIKKSFPDIKITYKEDLEYYKAIADAKLG